ncbi:1,4-alpha-glucan branching protein [Actinomadura sp. KC06]|uniref:maltokinase N-terminal cap-like domain-containing protein n=1 Tax=Actinomadura sp. KC06 TaxID=2530369 RepID=UPI00104331CC|nr:1,4-alpha-glucan branching protein [Actinomadura sp. KC06]TDD37284.1 1,4-alpha-glucan branching protein [Actinomadura sp. KC06]
MAFIHETTMTPGKLELLAAWLPARPWYAGSLDAPALSRSGGFRLDDPEGAVGIEFMVVTDTSSGAPVAYHVPLSYRGAPLDGADRALIGTSEHGVLGRRWVYDATRDPVAVGQLLALLQGRAEPQHQSRSDTPDTSVVSDFTGDGASALVALTSVEDARHGTDVTVEAKPHGALTIRVVRVLRENQPGTGDALGSVTAEWRSPDGGRSRGPFAVLTA